MTTCRASSILSRLRASSRLAALVLALFVLKIGTAAACTGHDFADLGLAVPGGHAAQMEVSEAKGDQPTTAAAHTGSCAHASGHQVADLANLSVAFAMAEPGGVAIGIAAPGPSRITSDLLRPPIV